MFLVMSKGAGESTKREKYWVGRSCKGGEGLLFTKAAANVPQLAKASPSFKPFFPMLLASETSGFFWFKNTRVEIGVSRRFR